MGERHKPYGESPRAAAAEARVQHGPVCRGRAPRATQSLSPPPRSSPRVAPRGSAAASEPRPAGAARLLARDQDRELQRVGEADSLKLVGGRLGGGKVAVLERPAEDRVRVA